MKQITFDSFVRGVLTVIVIAGIILLLNRLSAALLPFFLAWLIAYLLFPLVQFFQYRCHLHFRIVSILATFLAVALVAALFFMIAIPPVIDEMERVHQLLKVFIANNVNLQNIPDLIEDFLHEHLTEADIKAFITQEGFIDTVKQSVPKIWTVIAQTLNIASNLITLTMVALYTLFILLDYEKLTRGWVDLLPQRYRHFAQQLVTDVTTGMKLYFRGQAMVAFSVGVLFSIGFLIIGFPMAIGLGMFIGLLNMVPYLQLLGFVPTVILAVVQAADTGESFWFIMLSALIVFAVVQTIQDTILVPKIMGKVMGLNSAIILLSLSIWGSLLGILGMIIALPMTTLLITYYQKYVIRSKEVKEEKSVP